MIDLSRAQKIQIGVAALILSTAGYVLYRGMRPGPDMTIASWVERHFQGRNPNQPISPANPVDPAKTATVTIFACYDGRLEIAEYPKSKDQNASFSFEPDSRRTTFAVYKDPLQTIEEIRDPYKRVLMFAAYSAANKAPKGFFGRINLDAAQRKQEREAREKMMDAITVLENGAQTGTIQKDLYDKVMASLAAYRAKGGDSTKDPAKAELAHQVVAAAIAYISAINDTKMEAVNRYVATMDKLLKSEQKTKLASIKINVHAAQRRQRMMASAVAY